MTEHTQNTPLLKVENLSVGFQTKAGMAKAVDDISFALTPGKTFCLVGESGSGKSVTALAIMGLLPAPAAQIIAGSINFEGQELSRLSTAELNKIRGNHMAMIFQEPMTSLNPVFTIGEQIAEPLLLHCDNNRKAARAEAVRLLEAVGINNPQLRVKDYPHQLSGGQRQRVMIAMAMACSPKLLIADEPTTALDVSSQGQVLNLMHNLQDDSDSALLFITHDLDVVSKNADTVAVMYAGKIVETGPAAELLSSPLHPYTQGLLLSRPRIAANSRHARLNAIPGTVPTPLERPAGCAFSGRCPEATEECSIKMPPLKSVASAEGLAAPALARRQCRCWHV